jgi:hypothetical protein
MSLAPRALNMTRRSSDIDSGIVRMRSYPRAAATIARAMPVLPEVGSTSVVLPGVMSPRFSASLIIENLLARAQLSGPGGSSPPHHGFTCGQKQRNSPDTILDGVARLH